jgi:hypothetical protein
MVIKMAFLNQFTYSKQVMFKIVYQYLIINVFLNNLIFFKSLFSEFQISQTEFKLSTFTLNL